MYGLGWYPSTIDKRDYPLSAYIRGVSEVTDKIWEFTADALNQLDKPHCGGFTMAHYGICHPMPSIYTNDDGHDFYKQCKITDLQPGMENGTSCRSMAVTGKRLGMWKTYAFATSVDEIYQWILTEGSVMMGTEWYEGMFLPDENNIIHCTGSIAGGHAWLALGVNLNTGFIDGLTSWGPDFGDNGHFKISLTEFSYLFARQGEAIAAVEVAKVDPSVTENKGCGTTRLGKALRRVLG
jgi:hypothetical protein